MSKYYNLYWKNPKNEHLSDFPYKLPVVKRIAPKTPNLTIMDFGCGSGNMLSEIMKLNPKSKYIGIDVSDIAIKKIKERFPKEIFFAVEDGGKIPVKTGSVDFILALDVIEHVYNTKETLSELARILKPGGRILITTPYHGLLKNLIIIFFFFEYYFDIYGSHIRFFSKKSLMSLLKDVRLKVVNFGYFGRFFPLSRAMFALAEK